MDVSRLDLHHTQTLAQRLIRLACTSSADTELGVLMEPEVSHGEAKIYAGVQPEAVRLIRDRGVSYAQASSDLKVHPTQL